MKSNMLWCKSALLSSVLALVCLAAGCGGSNNNNDDGGGVIPVDPQTNRNYEMTADGGSFKAVDSVDGELVFQLTLTGMSSDLLYFTTEDPLAAGNETVDNLVNNIWPTEFDTIGPNAVVRYSADGDFYEVLCFLNDPVYDASTGVLDFTITYLDGSRPVDELALTGVKVIILSNTAEGQAAQWSTILNGGTGTLAVTDDSSVYLLTIEGVDEDLISATSAPSRNSVLGTAEDLVRSWETEFGDTPPNAALSYSPPINAEGGVQIVSLADPVYDGERKLIHFTVKSLYGTTAIDSGLSVSHPTLTIDGVVGHTFPPSEKNHFSIRYRNSTAEAVTVWLNGTQPPCSQAEATNCAAGAIPANYTNEWNNMKDAFAASGTHFYILSSTTGEPSEIDVTNRIDLAPGETLRIVPPLDENNYPEWYYYNSIKDQVETAGVTGWVTKSGVDMPAAMQVNLFEYNVDHPALTIWADISGVDGINSNATLTWEGPGCGDDPDCGTGVSMPRRLMTNIDAYDGENDGCPHIMVVSGANTCPNPKHYPATITATPRPDWVVGSGSFTTDDVASDYHEYWVNAGSPSGLEMCAAASGLPDPKEAYHIWWATNPVGLGWLDYLQKNAGGRCDAYGWAYDEKKWKPGDSFDQYGNPPDNTSVNPLFSGSMKDDTYLNIDILKVM